MKALSHRFFSARSSFARVAPKALFLASIGLATSLAARDASACGGTFCDNGGPMQMSVDQKGENILFVSDGTSIEAHIQIQYDGKSAARFAWIIPVQSEPTSITVGSQQLFTNLLQGTVPSYGFTTVNDCQNFGGCLGASGTGAGGATSGAGGSSSGAAGSGPGGGPVVTFKATVGSFDVAVLKGGTADSVMQWLADNQYQQIPAAKAIFEDYLASGHLFVAVKMTNGVGVDEIHPLVVKYVGQQPCVPLKLTAVAAVENMGVRAFFLGKGRWVPTNYMHMVVNDARVDWPGFGKNYAEVITNAADSPVADGHAFATEYAGSSVFVPQNGIYSPQWDPSPFPSIPVTEVVNALAKQGLASCQVGNQCTYGHPLVAGLLHEFLPPPAGVSDPAFYGCLSCYQKQIDLTKWDGIKFSQALITRVIQPSAHAEDLLQKNAYVTRLFTTISPAEMTVDPEFHERADLPPVTDKALATRHLKCGGVTGMVLPDSREVGLIGGAWPSWDASMPWVERVEQIPLVGAPIVLVDHLADIDAAVFAWNKAQAYPPPPPPPPAPCTTGGVGGNSAGTGGNGGTTSGTAAGGSPSVGGSAAQDKPAGSEASGGCSTTRDRSSGLGAALLALAGALALRRRPKR